jgi:hypothetical protein
VDPETSLISVPAYERQRISGDSEVLPKHSANFLYSLFHFRPRTGGASFEGPALFRERTQRLPRRVRLMVSTVVETQLGIIPRFGVDTNGELNSFIAEEANLEFFPR